ncbi:MAG TPA: potassium channel family protein [Pyrinomonadaceae bacterium]|nr:potassium channel family protein [Pyrinomonadaceae bacterium]
MLRPLLIAFVIVSICVVIHILGLTYLAEALVARRPKLVTMKTTGHACIVLVVFAAIVTLHMIETAIWAGFYLWWNLFPDFETSWYFSLTSYTTIGYGDVTLPEGWRVLGGIEGFSGVLLCGLSTAFILIILNAMLTNRIQTFDPGAVPGGINEIPR